MRKELKETFSIHFIGFWLFSISAYLVLDQLPIFFVILMVAAIYCGIISVGVLALYLSELDK